MLKYQGYVAHVMSGQFMIQTEVLQHSNIVNYQLAIYSYSNVFNKYYLNKQLAICSIIAIQYIYKNTFVWQCYIQLVILGYDSAGHLEFHKYHLQPHYELNNKR